MSDAEEKQVACACGVGSELNQCCGPFIEGTQNPETAEQLMRSRYTAYANENIDYILSSHNPETVKEVDRESSEQWAKEANWQGLQIVNREGGGVDDDDGVVEFVAQYSIGPNSYAHHERATFRKIEGVWKFIDGEMVKAKPSVRETPKVGRNEPCPCGSGKKFKKCCG